MTIRHRRRTAAGTGGNTPPVPAFRALRFEGLDVPVLLPEDPRLIDDLHQCIHGWPSRMTTLAAGAVPDRPPVTVIERRSPGRYRAFSRYLDEGLDDLPAATAVCAVLADLSQAFCAAGEDLVFGLHCGAVSIGRTGLILAGERRAGKSTLVARLSAEPGIEVLCDDVLPVDDKGMAVGLGLAPRLRLPLPDTASPAFRAHVARWLGPSDDRYGYLTPPSLAPHGRRARADVLLLLDRRPDAVAALHLLPDEDVLRAVIDRSISGPQGTEAVFEAASSLASRLRGLRLVYWDLEEAVALLKAAFPSGHAPPDGKVRILPPLPPSAPEPDPGQAALVAPATRFRRRPGTATRRFGEAAFIWRPDDAMLWHLNLTAQSIWLMLEEPANARDLARDLGQVFPDVSSRQLLEDVRRLLARLRDEGLVIAAG